MADYSLPQLDERSITERNGSLPIPIFNRYRENDKYNSFGSSDSTYSRYSASKEVVQYSAASLGAGASTRQVPWMKRRSCGLPRWIWTTICLSLLIVVVAVAVVVAIITTRKASVPLVPVADPLTVNSQDIQTYQVMVDAQIVAYGSNVSAEDASNGAPSTHMYFQSAFGNNKEINQSIAFQQTTTAYSIVFDAMNMTGQAIFPYQNGSQQQSSFIYVDDQNVLSEFRSFPGLYVAERWQPGPLKAAAITVQGSSTFGSGTSLEEPKNGWDSTRMTAVSSANFPNGTEARLFMHRSNSTMNFIQELIWTLKDDTWSMGVTLPGCVPQSHFHSMMDSSGQILRLFYASPNNTLSEYRLNVTDPNATYTPGINMPNLLMNPSADFAAVSVANGDFLYYASAPSPQSNVTIRELPLPMSTDPNAQTVQHPDASSDIVVTPNLLAPNPTNSSMLTSLYAPLTAVSFNEGRVQQITVYWADNPVDPQGGYQRLNSITRTTVQGWPSSTSGNNAGTLQQLPLGHVDCQFGKCTPFIPGN